MHSLSSEYLREQINMYSFNHIYSIPIVNYEQIKQEQFKIAQREFTQYMKSAVWVE